MSLGRDGLRTGPTSEAQVSPALHASAPSSDRHIHDAVYCRPKSMAISPGPTCHRENHHTLDNVSTSSVPVVLF